MVLIDPIFKTISASVRDLADEPGFSRIGLGRDGWASFATGSRMHEHIQSVRVTADPSYQKEIHLEVKIPVDGWTAIITGRIDGIRTDTDGACIEEFKTATLIQGKSAWQNPGFERHKRQLLIYCDLWSRLGRPVVSAQVVYIDPDTRREEAVVVEFDPASQAAKTETRVRQLLREWQSKEETRQRKAALAGQLPFPHAAPRAGQEKLITAIRDALETNGLLLAEAATGSGKTAASLYPAMQHALRTGKQLVFLTAKTMQQTLAMRVLDAMNRDKVFRAVQLRAKEKMCANDRVFCHEDVCPYARRYPAKMEKSGILDKLLNGDPPSPDEIFKAAKAEEVCPFEVQLELSRHADVVVADYNYVFDPGVALQNLRDEGLRDAILVIDEAHNLPDRLRAIFSPELTEAGIVAALDAAKKLNLGARAAPLAAKSMAQLDLRITLDDSPKRVQELPGVLQQLLALLRKCAAHWLRSERDGTVEIVVPRAEFLKLWEAWKPAFFGYAGWKQDHKMFLEDDPIADLHFALQPFISILRFVATGENKKPGNGFATIIEKRGVDLRLAILCLNPAVPAAPIFKETSAVVFLSATLQPFDLFARLLGLEASRISTVALPSPFPRENRRVLVLPQVRTNFTAREKNLPKIAALIGEIDEAHGGNKLVLLPSYEFLRRIEAELPKLPSARSGRIPLMERLRIQSVNATEKERAALMKSLAAPPTGGLVLLAVLGGMFAEGVDYPGELLETVVVVSPGLPQVSFERELLRRYYDENAGSGFEYAYLQPGMTRVVQAAGRLIRTETDRGVIALICGRFLEDGYVQRLPREWYRNSPAELISERPRADIENFFAGTGAEN